MMLPIISSSELSATSANHHVSNSLLSPPLPPELDVALVAALDGTIYLVDTKLGKIRWSFATGRPIYSSYQAFNNASEFYIDVGEDWQLYFHSFDKLKKLSWSAEEYIKGMPYISNDGSVTVGAMKTTVFLVDAKSGTVVDNDVVDFSESTLGFQRDETKPVTSGLVNSKTTRQLVYIMRTDYVIKSAYTNPDEILWNVAYADIKAEFRCQEMGDYHFNSGSDLRKEFIESSLTTSVYRLRDNSLLDFLSVIGGNRKFPPSSEMPLTLKISDGSFGESNNKHTFAEGFRFKIQSFTALFVGLCSIIRFLFYRSNTNNEKVQNLTPNETNSVDNNGHPPNETNSVDNNGHRHIDGNIENFFFDGCVDGCRIGKLVVSKKVIAKGNDGNSVLEGNYEGRAVAVKHIVKSHLVMSLKEIQNLIASEQHPNVVRWYGVESDHAFVYLAVERCTCSLYDLIYVLSGSFENLLNAKDRDSDFLNKARIRLLSVMENTKDIELWKANGHPSAQLLKLMRDIVSGLFHIHEIGLIHQDLTPHNIFITKDKSLRAKLSPISICKRRTGYESSGWQAPEQLRQGLQTRAVDLFGLGCVLFFCITGGKHPYGKSFLRACKIVRNEKNLFPVEHIPEAMDLFTGLLDPNQNFRPDAEEVLDHPFLWTPETRLSFLQDVSDYVEMEDKESDSEHLTALALEGIAPVAVNGKWDEKLETKFIDNIGRNRRYDSIQDLLWVIRNKSNHYKELPEDIQELLGSHPEGFYDYFSSRFPKLFIEVYNVISKYCYEEEFFAKYITID